MSSARHAGRQVDRDVLIQRVVGEMRALSTVMDQVDAYAADRFGVNRTDLRALDVIGQTDGISPTQLAVALKITTSAVTTVIDRLERAGYVSRSPVAGDRRRTVVRATPLLVKLGLEIFGRIVQSAFVDAQHFSNEQLVAIADFLARRRTGIVAVLESLAASSSQAEPARASAPHKAHQTPPHRASASARTKRGAAS